MARVRKSWHRHMAKLWRERAREGYAAGRTVYAEYCLAVARSHKIAGGK